ncbi:MAG: COX15/CtaA family protein [Pirellulaceae bacterium]
MELASTTNKDQPRGHSRAVYALAVILTVAVFPLIWVGGLVTTYDAGMAVPDWPSTYQENMFTYSRWITGPFDLLVEHGHRLLGSLAGIISIGLVVAAWRYEPRPWFRWWAIFILFTVIAQGALGGFRVLLDQRTAAMIHGCVGPLFFALSTATAVMSSRWWRIGADRQANTPRTIAWMASLLVVFSYIQLVIGAQLRHVTGVTPPRVFTAFVHLHLTLAALVMLVTLLLAGAAGLSRRTPGKVSSPSFLLVALLLVQVALGIGSWIVNYALPWQELNAALAAYVIQAKGYTESLIVTAHVATGSLIISLSTVAALRSWRSLLRT